MENERFNRWKEKMTITNGYCTLQNFKDYQRITSVDTADDSFIEKCIEGASRWIDSESNTTFFGNSETRKYNIFKALSWKQDFGMIDTVVFDVYFSSISSIINGDGTVIPATDYSLLPMNDSPKWGMYLHRTGSTSFNYNSTEFIQVVGVTGYSTSAPTDIYLACLEITKAMYNRRYGENMGMKTVITPSGVIQMPEGVPDWAANTVAGYRRISMG